MPRLLTTCLLLILALPLAGQVPTFPPAIHGDGDLMHVHGVPVLTLRGTPAQMGEQFGVLAIQNAPGLPRLLDAFLADTKTTDSFDGLKTLARGLKKQFPPAHTVELDAAAKAGAFDPGTVYFANTVYDLSSGMGCSTILVEKDRSRTGFPVFGRNFDWVPSQGITEHTLVVVYRPTGKKAFATITISPIAGCISGMNESGLAITINEILLRHAKDRAAFNWGGIPTLALFRQVLEECSTVAEAEAFVRKANRMTAACMSVCDMNGGAVIEFTPKTVAVRSPSRGVTLCTNHFTAPGLGTDRPCWRLDKLMPLQKDDAKLGVSEVFARLHDVNQGVRTLQSMVFEPASRKLHLKYGPGPATTRPAVELELFR